MCMWVCMCACLEYTYTRSLTFMSGFISSTWRCPLRSADSRRGDGGNMAIIWACRDGEQTFVSLGAVWYNAGLCIYMNAGVCLKTSISWDSSIVCLFLSLSFSAWRFSISLCSSLPSHNYTTNREQKRLMSAAKISSHTTITYLWWSEKIYRKSLWPEVSGRCTDTSAFHQNDMTIFYLLVTLV